MQYRSSRSRLRWAAVFFFSVALLRSGAVLSWDMNSRFCFPDVINTPDTYLQPPAIDGVVSGDNGWTSARRTAFNNGTFVHDVTVQGIRDAGFLYFSFEVNHDESFDNEDVIVIALDPTGDAADRRLLHVSPVIPTGAASPVPMLYWQGYPWTGGGAAPPAGTQAVATVSGGGTNRSWFVELKLPRPGFAIPAAMDFGLYLNVIPVNGVTTGPTGLYFEFPWPLATPPLTLDLLNTPSEATWGQATVSAASPCNGVYITAADIRTDNIPPSKIKLDAANKFRVTVHNSSTNGSGVAIPVSGINATFKIANFGLSNAWQNVPATGPGTNPTTPPAPIGASSTIDLTTDWLLNATEQAAYDTPSTRHQCILVELDTNAARQCLGGSNPGAPCQVLSCAAGGTCTGGVCVGGTDASRPCCEGGGSCVGDSATTFSGRSAWTNMNFGPASTVSFPATIDPRGWERPTGAERRLELFITRQVDRLDRDDVQQGAAQEARVRGPRGDASSGSWRDLQWLDFFPVENTEQWEEFLSILEKPRTQVSQLTYLVHGCLHTGQFITIRRNRYELCDRVGSYGYVARHAGPGTPTWSDELTGPGLEKQGENRYQLTLPDDQPVILENRLEARDTQDFGAGRRRWSLSLHAGVNDPRGNAGNFLDGDTSYGVDLQYHFFPALALELYYGIDEFDGAAAFLDKVEHLSLNLKGYYGSGGVRPFLLAGVGRYDLTPGGDPENGYDAGAGLQFNLSSVLALELEGRYHWVDLGPNRFEFITAHGVLRIRF